VAGTTLRDDVDARSIDPGLTRAAAARSPLGRAFEGVVQLLTFKPLLHRHRAKARDLKRVLLVAPPSDPVSAAPADVSPGSGLEAIAESLRAAGFQAEVYDAMTSSLGALSIRLEIEHSYPHVVATSSSSETAEAARAILRAAKEVIPGVCTVLLTRSTRVACEAPGDGVVDCVVGDDCARTLPGLLAGLKATGRFAQTAESHAA